MIGLFGDGCSPEMAEMPSGCLPEDERLGLRLRCLHRTEDEECCGTPSLEGTLGMLGFGLVLPTANLSSRLCKGIQWRCPINGGFTRAKSRLASLSMKGHILRITLESQGSLGGFA